MGLFDDMSWGTLGGMVLGGPVGAIAGDLLIDGPNGQQKRADKLQWDEGEQRKTAKQTQYDLLNGMQGPSLSPQMQTRLKALQDESQPGPLSQDPYFQGQRAQVVQGGQQALARVDNRHAAYNTAGGFSNQGSVNDAYDRLGAQMAQLGSQSANLKDQKSQMAAHAYQQFQDAQTEFRNAQIKAKMAIEAGDSQAAMAAIQQAYMAKQQIDANQQKMFGNLLSLGGTIAGGAMGGPAGAKAGAAPGQAISSAAPEVPDYASQLSYSDPTSMPYSLVR